MTYSILITTRDRLEELKFTLAQCAFLLERNDTEFIVCDDGSTDGTFDYIKSNFPSIKLIGNKKSKGLIFSRNRMLAITMAKYAISLDDDAHFISHSPLEVIGEYFENNPKCGVQAFRIYWGKEKPENTVTLQNPQRVKGFVGCGHVWRMEAWRAIPDYPEWFKFYGEEEFAGYHLFLNNWHINYIPEILVHHRVNVKSRKKDKDYTSRLRKSLRAGWYLYLMFIPLQYIPRKMLYSIWMQLKSKVFKGDGKALIAILLALVDIVLNCRKIYRNSHRFSKKEWQAYTKLEDTKIYWKPNVK